MIDQVDLEAQPVHLAIPAKSAATTIRMQPKTSDFSATMLQAPLEAHQCGALSRESGAVRSHLGDMWLKYFWLRACLDRRTAQSHAIITSGKIDIGGIEDRDNLRLSELRCAHGNPLAGK